MGKKVTFIHASDIHLGAPFKGLRSLSESWANVLLRAIPESFQRVVDAALAERVDFVVMPGDVFDSARPSYADFHLFVQGLQRLAEAHIPVYFCTGNHDPYTTWQHDFATLPEGVHLFGASAPSFCVFEKEGEPCVLLGGRGYYSQAWPEGEDISEGISREEAVAHLGVDAPFMVGVIHTGLNIDPTRSPVKPKALLSRGVTYWACGHIHQHMCLPSEEDPRIVFSGCPQGRDMKETGEHGVYKVTLEEGAPNRVEFIPTAQVAWQRFAVDVSECATIAEIHERIANEQFSLNALSHCQRMVCRVELTGRTHLHKELDQRVLEEVRKSINEGYPFFLIDAIENRTQSELDRAQFAAEGLFPSVFLEALQKEKLNRADTLLMLEREFYSRDLSMPKEVERRFDSLCEDAETMVLDLLAGGDGK